MEDFGAVVYSVDDRLGRAAFAESLARFIHDMAASSEGFVIGIEGEWGSGKSSVINMTAERLLHLEMTSRSSSDVFYREEYGTIDLATLQRLAKVNSLVPDWPITVDYDYFCLDVVKRQLCEAATDQNDEAKLIYRYFRLKKLIEREPRNLCINFQPWLMPEATELATFFIRELSLSIGEKLGRNVANTAANYRQAVADIAPIAGAASNLIAPGFGSLIEGMSHLFSREEEATLESRKRDLEVALRKLHGQKIVVFIDDLDRLLPAEAAQMVSLVKGLGRLPNVVYVLSYDQDNLSKLISTATKLDGGAYLEKIVQYKRPLPLLPENALSVLIDRYLDRAVPRIEGAALKRLQEAWSDVIRKGIRTPRDAIRVGSSFLTGWIEVGEFLDASDFLILQLTLHNDPELYHWIRENIRTLCGMEFRLTGNSVAEIIAAFVTDQAPARKRVLANLFPKAAEALGTYGSSGLSTARADRRIQVYDYRSAYFDLSPPGAAMSRVEVEELLVSAAPLPILEGYLRRAEASADGVQMRTALLADLRQYFGDGNAITFEMAHAVIAISPSLIRLADESFDFFQDDNLSRMVSILFRGLDAVQAEERSDLVLRLINTADDYSLLSRVLRTALGAVDPLRRDREGLSFVGRESEIRRALLSRIKELVDNLMIFEQASPRSLIWFWWDSEPEAPSKFLNGLVQDPRFFAKIVDMTIGTVVSSEKGRYEAVAQEAREIVSLSALDAAAKMFSGLDDAINSTAARRYMDARAASSDG